MNIFIFLVFLLLPVSTTVFVVSNWDIHSQPAMTDEEFQDEMGVYNEFGQ